MGNCGNSAKANDNTLTLKKLEKMLQKQKDSEQYTIEEQFIFKDIHQNIKIVNSEQSYDFSLEIYEKRLQQVLSETIKQILEIFEWVIEIQKTQLVQNKKQAIFEINLKILGYSNEEYSLIDSYFLREFQKNNTNKNCILKLYKTQFKQKLQIPQIELDDNATLEFDLRHQYSDAVFETLCETINQQNLQSLIIINLNDDIQPQYFTDILIKIFTLINNFPEKKFERIHIQLNALFYTNAYKIEIKQNQDGKLQTLIRLKYIKNNFDQVIDFCTQISYKTGVLSNFGNFRLLLDSPYKNGDPVGKLAKVLKLGVFCLEINSSENILKNKMSIIRINNNQCVILLKQEWQKLEGTKQELIFLLENIDKKEKQEITIKQKSNGNQDEDTEYKKYQQFVESIFEQKPQLKEYITFQYKYKKEEEK